MTLPLQENDEVEQYVPPVPKQWISLGSEIEIDEERLVLNRPLVRIFENELKISKNEYRSFRNV